MRKEGEMLKNKNFKEGTKKKKKILPSELKFCSLKIASENIIFYIFS